MRITQLAEVWKSGKVAKDGERKKRKSEDMQVEAFSSGGGVDIIMDLSRKPKVTPLKRSPRLRG